MPRTAVITQPTYLPWLGYFQLVSKADVFVFLDCVQFVKQSWHSRNRLKSSSGEPFWLTVPVTSHSLDTRGCDIRISPDRPKWKTDHIQSVRTALGSAPYFSEVFPELEAWLRESHERLTDLNVSGIRRIAMRLGFSPEFIMASELDPQGKRTSLLIDLLKKIGATHYYANMGSRQYLEADRQLFEDVGISYAYQQWRHPEYHQRGGIFLSNLAWPDPLCHLGWEGARRAIIEG